MGVMGSVRTSSAASRQGALSGGEFFATYRPQTAVIAEARDEFSTWLAETAPGSTVHDEMLVVFSELLANAFAASTDDRSAVAFRAWVRHPNSVRRPAWSKVDLPHPYPAGVGAPGPAAPGGRVSQPAR